MVTKVTWMHHNVAEGIQAIISYRFSPPTSLHKRPVSQCSCCWCMKTLSSQKIYMSFNSAFKVRDTFCLKFLSKLLCDHESCSIIKETYKPRKKRFHFLPETAMKRIPSACKTEKWLAAGWLPQCILFLASILVFQPACHLKVMHKLYLPRTSSIWSSSMKKCDVKVEFLQQESRGSREDPG